MISDFIKMYKFTLKNGILALRICLSSAIFLLLLSFYKTSNAVIFSYSFIFWIIIFACIQIKATKFFLNDKALLTTLPIRYVNLYPLSVLFAVISLIAPYLIIYFSLTLYFLGKINVTFIQLFTIIMLQLYISAMFLYKTKSTAASKKNFIKFILNMIFAQVVFATTLLGLFSLAQPDDFQVIKPISFNSIIVIEIIVLILNMIFSNTFNIKNKRIKSKKSSIKHSIVENTEHSSMKKLSIDKLIAYANLSGLKYPELLLLIAVFSAINIFQKNNIANIFIFIISYTAFYFTNSSTIKAFIGLPITPKQIYLATLKVRTIIAVLFSTLFLLINWIITKQIELSSILYQLMILLVIYVSHECIYSPFRNKNNYSVFLVTNFFVTAMPNLPIVSETILLIFDFILFILLIITILYKTNTINKEKQDILSLVSTGI